MNQLSALLASDNILTGPVGILISALALAIVAFASWKDTGRRLIIGVTLLLYARYMIWRGFYTLNTSTWIEAILSASVYLAEAYGVVQLALFAYQVWNKGNAASPAITVYRSVDIFVPVVNEPLEILRRTLVGCTHQDYPADKYRVYVLDDGRRDDVRQLAKSLGCGYLRREERTHAKAGNINHALGQTTGELITVFDTDHVPCASFLRETVGFFDDPKIAFVQTPQHFYNADVFQKNLRLESQLPNEQALFFRVIQPGRDHHNSAFFAGSCGVFRRTILLEVGGFQTDTITEDIHTSLLVHGKGYRSRYLNKPLAAGLMPETFGSFCKQRMRWATGTMQMLFRSNPLTLPGLTLSQRIDYFGSVHYFMFGIPRIIWLSAPLFGLLFSMPVVHATTWDLVHLFGTAFVASLVMMKSLSQGTRGPFWSDIYETAMCFRLGWVVFTTLLRPYQERPFFVTPKGQAKKQRLAISTILPHLVLLGLLAVGISAGMEQWLRGRVTSGVEVSFFWGVLNLMLVTVAILASLETYEGRKTYRIRRHLPCLVIADKDCFKSTIEDLSENGALVRLPNPALKNTDKVLISLLNTAGDRVTIEARIRRRVPGASGDLAINVEFVDVDDKTAHALIALMFGESDIWEQQAGDSRILNNIRLVLSVIATKLGSLWKAPRRDGYAEQSPYHDSKLATTTFGDARSSKVPELDGGAHDSSASDRAVNPPQAA
ncbi:glycosyltransferase [Petrachloros mirabilis]